MAAYTHSVGGTQWRFDSLREAYGSMGPDAYYRSHGDDYRNPHEGVITNQ